MFSLNRRKQVSRWEAHDDRDGRGDAGGPRRRAWFAEVRELARARDAVLLAHNYQLPEIQDVADHTGDSLALSRIAAESSASTIVFCGVHFMAETAKILAPDKTVLIPDARAGCSLADSITADELRAWKAEHPGAVVVSYVNTTAAVKAETDVCCTSSQRRRGGRVDPGRPRGAVPARPVPRRARPPDHWAGRTCTSGRGSATCTRASTAPSWPRRPPPTPTPSCSCTPSAAARPPRSTWPAAARCPPTGSRSSRRAGCSTRRGSVDGARRCWWPPRSGCCTSCAGPPRRSTSGRSTTGPPAAT